MPFTDDFTRIRRHFRRFYRDVARADTFAFEEAFKKGIPTFQTRRRRFKRQLPDALKTRRR